MPIYKQDNGTWYVMARYTDWTGKNKQKCQRGFTTKRDAQEWERQFQLQKHADIDMTMESQTGLVMSRRKLLIAMHIYSRQNRMKWCRHSIQNEMEDEQYVN